MNPNDVLVGGILGAGGVIAYTDNFITRWIKRQGKINRIRREEHARFEKRVQLRIDKEVG